MTQDSLVRRSATRSDDGRLPRLQGRYGLLLLLLIANYLLSAFSSAALAEPLQVALFTVVLVLALRNSPLDRRQARLVGWSTVVVSAAVIGAALTRTDVGYGVADIWKSLILLLSVVFIVRRVLAQPTVTLQSIYGALSAYLIVGLMFAALYAAMEHLGYRPFFAHGQPANPQTFQYFSFTTLTTLGYGDFTAVNNGGRAIAVMEALAGQVFLATLVARLVAAFRGPAGQARPAETGRRPPRALRRAPAMTHRRRPAGNAAKISSGARASPTRSGNAVAGRAPRSGP